MVNNPLYKGKWKAPLVENLNYQVGSSGENMSLRSSLHYLFCQLFLLIKCN